MTLPTPSRTRKLGKSGIEISSLAWGMWRFAGLELQDLPRRDQHTVAVFGIATQARRMLGHCKATEPRDFDATARAQGAIEGLQNRLGGQFRVRECQLPEATGQGVDEV